MAKRKRRQCKTTNQDYLQKKIKLQVLRENHKTRQCVHLQICMVLMNQEIPRL